jgi:hypothetical protein
MSVRAVLSVRSVRAVWFATNYELLSQRLIRLWRTSASG